MRRLLGALWIALLFALPAHAQTRIEDGYCRMNDLPGALRQTIIVIDGALVAPEAAGPSDANRPWRQFALQFLDAGDAQARQRLDAHERISIGIANADGSGFTMLFSGCVPLVRPEEEATLSKETSILDVFFGADWQRKQKDAAEKFTRSAAMAMVEGLKALPPAGAAGPVAFPDSGFVASLGKSVGYTLEGGLPRVILVTDLTRYDLPEGTASAVRALGRADADRAGVNLLRAEVHVFGSAGAQKVNEREYLDAFVLSSRGHLATLTSAGGALTAIGAPRSVAVYQGVVDYGDTRYPLRMRLARDQNSAVVNSWIEMQASVAKFVPFFGIISCKTDTECEYVGDNIFAQVWDDEPGPKADLQPWEPFGGMRGLRFDIAGEQITGLINDETGFIVGSEDGLRFEMQIVKGGLF